MAKAVQSACDVWKEANFTLLLKDLDAIATEIADDNDKSESSRKVLIEKNRRFKEQVSMEARKEVAPLLKCFQNEVDRLIKNNKSLETHLLKLYKKLIDLPDPLLYLEQMSINQKKLLKMQDVMLENTKLRESLEEYNKEFSEVRNQEITVKQLRDKVKELEAKMSANVELRCKEKEREIQNTFNEKENELAMEKMECRKRIEDYEHRVNVAESNLMDCQSELFRTKIRLDELSSAKTSELELLTLENDRMTQSIKQMENQIQIYEAEKRDFNDGQSGLKCQTNEFHIHELEELQTELSIKDDQMKKLNEEIRNQRKAIVQKENNFKQQMNEMNELICKKDNEIDNFTKLLDQQHDYNEIKRELNIIKSIEFSSNTNFVKDDDATDTTNTTGVLTADAHKTLEQLLFDKNKTLQNQLLQEKSVHNKLKNIYETMNYNYQEAQVVIKNQKELIESLEDDLHQIKTLNSKHQPTNEFGHLLHTNDADDASVISHTSLVSPNYNKANEAEILANVIEERDSKTPIDEQASSSLLNIVQSQRDRFKRRALDLEQANQTYATQIQTLQQDIDQTKSDNAKLYEKVRYLQSYDNRSEISQQDGTLSRYSNEYEANLNPFENFHRQERQRQYNALPPHEKIMFSMSKFVMGSRTARLFAFMYTVLLHCLVFGVLYKFASTENSARDQSVECKRRFADHMLRAHGHKNL